MPRFPDRVVSLFACVLGLLIGGAASELVFAYWHVLGG